VVAGAGSDDAAGLLGVGEPGDPHRRAAELEGAGALEVLALEHHPDTGDVAERGALLDRRARGHALEQGRSLLDLGEVDPDRHGPLPTPGSRSGPASRVAGSEASTEACSAARSSSGSAVVRSKESSMERKSVPGGPPGRCQSVATRGCLSWPWR